MVPCDGTNPHYYNLMVFIVLYAILRFVSSEELVTLRYVCHLFTLYVNVTHFFSYARMSSLLYLFFHCS